MKWIKTIALWVVAAVIIAFLYMFGITDTERMADLDGPNPFRPLFRVAFAWIMGGIVFVVAVFMSRRTMED